MPIGDVHNHPSASIICDCPAHQEARKALVEAHKTAVAILAARRVHDEEQANKLLPELERLNAIASQEIE